MTGRVAILLKVVRERRWDKHEAKFYFLLADLALTASFPRQQMRETVPDLI